MKLSDNAYNGLNKIAEKTKMDCWFFIRVVGEDDEVFDLENGEFLPMEVALSQFAEGIIDPLEEYGLTEDEKKDVTELFDNLGIVIGG